MAEGTPFLTADDLLELARRMTGSPGCKTCSALVCPGWESVPGGFDLRVLEQIGTLRRETDEEPMQAEYHPGGTHGWSVDAPIATEYFPYNRCQVWACSACRRLFLRYTEYGGYYTDERIREVASDLIVSTFT